MFISIAKSALSIKFLFALRGSVYRAVVAHAFNPSTREAEAALGYRVKSIQRIMDAQLAERAQP